MNNLIKCFFLGQEVNRSSDRSPATFKSRTVSKYIHSNTTNNRKLKESFSEQLNMIFKEIEVSFIIIDNQKATHSVCNRELTYLLNRAVG